MYILYAKHTIIWRTKKITLVKNTKSYKTERRVTSNTCALAIRQLCWSTNPPITREIRGWETLRISCFHSWVDVVVTRPGPHPNFAQSSR